MPMTPEQVQQHVAGHTPAELYRTMGSGALAEHLAEYLMLTGIKLGQGDLNAAMMALGLVLCRNDDTVTQLPSLKDQLLPWLEADERMMDPAWKELREEGRCPKCGLPRYRLRENGNGWWHVSDHSEWGYQRSCWNPGMIALLDDDELAERDRFLATRRR